MSSEPKACVFAVREPCLRIDSRGNERQRALYVCKLGMYEKGVGCGPGKCAYFSHKNVAKNRRFWAIKKFKKIASA
jgi:hypothetical protein